MQVSQLLATVLTSLGTLPFGGAHWVLTLPWLHEAGRCGP
jgi:hypothetical protein